MLEEWLYLQPRGGTERERDGWIDGENGGMGYRGTESRGEGAERRSQGGGAGIMEGGEERTERGEGQVVMNVLLFTACCLQYGCVCMHVCVCVCMHVGAVAVGHL